ncbi:MAG: bifunctional chorismate mutase/prephenate dehydratase, partial [Clostridia bacterium]|nr:bifunctional chorismate mutase/prephenate dehydratase [Clostridia bacterium]
LDQCAEYIREHNFTPEGATNTAVAAKQVAENADPTVAAIASVETAKLYGLQILERNINESSVNTTRFAVFSKAAKAENNTDRNFFLFFTVKNEAGCLAKAINAIGDAGFNMRALKSRPTKELIWEYYFTAEIEGNPHTERGHELLLRLGEICSSVKVLGSYDRELQLKG